MRVKPWQLGCAIAGIALGVAAARIGDRPVSVPAGLKISVRSGSLVLENGAMQPGKAVSSGRLAATVAARAAAALSLIPQELRPVRTTLEIEPSYAGAASRVQGLEFQSDVLAIVVGDGGMEASKSVWLHELGHLRLAGSRPQGALARRLTDAIEEGTADYFAAAIGGDPVLGSGEARRDLRSPPRVGASEWASLAFAGFDTHRMGWLFAARLYELDPHGGSLLRDVVACLDGESALGQASDSPAAVVTALLAACPEQGRSRLARVLADWLPEELRAVEIPT